MYHVWEDPDDLGYFVGRHRPADEVAELSDAEFVERTMPAEDWHNIGKAAVRAGFGFETQAEPFRVLAGYGGLK